MGWEVIVRDAQGAEILRDRYRWRWRARAAAAQHNAAAKMAADQVRAYLGPEERESVGERMYTAEVVPA